VRDCVGKEEASEATNDKQRPRDTELQERARHISLREPDAYVKALGHCCMDFAAG
jgi:hypothetical protein